MIKAPYFSTSFSKNGKKIKKRFDNILNMNKSVKGKGYFVFAVALIMLAGTLVACSNESIGIIGGSDGPTSVYVSDGKTTAQKLYDAKLKYIGNHVGVGKVLSPLGSIKGLECTGFELQTTAEPYGMIISYRKTGDVDYDEMKRQAAVVLCLIENAGFVEYNIDGESVRYTIDDLNAQLGADLKKSGESLESFTVLYNSLYAPVGSLDEGISRAILSQNSGGYLGGECVGEGHIILKTEPEDEAQAVLGKTVNTVVYALASYCEFGFVDDAFVDVGGCGVEPVKIVLDKDYKLVSFTFPQDGSYYVPSVKDNFPKELWSRALNVSSADRTECDAQENKYAEEYLKRIGRDAKISRMSELDRQSVRISAEAANKLFDSYGEYYPIVENGSRETVIDGVRYKYVTAYSGTDGKGKITFSKYADGKLAEKTVINVDGDKLSYDELYNAPKLLEEK